MTDISFWDRIAPKYAQSPISDPDAYEETLARVRTYLGADTQALELGCGTGSTALKLHAGTKRYVATDISAGMIGIAQTKITEQAGPQPEFRVARVAREDYAGEDFNAVLAFNLLHLLPDLEKALAVIHGLLPEDGLFISKTPALGSKWYYRPMIGAMRAFGRAPYVNFFSVEDLDARMAAAGFRLVETGLYPPKTPSRFLVARKL